MSNRFDPERHHRRSIRLNGYDYSSAGAYFVTICTRGRECILGDVVNGEWQMNEFGQVVKEYWGSISGHFKNIITDEFIVMPNHLHGIVVISYSDCRGEVTSPSPISKTYGAIQKDAETTMQGGETPPLQIITLGKIIAYFKYQSAIQINQIRNTSGLPVWQRNYYEHIIRDEDDMNRYREYIVNNPLKWAMDENNPVNIT